MTTVLFYLVIAAVIGLVVFFGAVLVFGRGEQMAPLDPRTSPAELPDHDIDSDDVRKIRFALALRGYRMSDVDWTLERLGEQIDGLRLENAQLRDQVALAEDQVALAEDPEADRPDGTAEIPVVATPSDGIGVPAPAAPARAPADDSAQQWEPPHSWPAGPAEQSPASGSLDDRSRTALTERAPAPAVDR